MKSCGGMQAGHDSRGLESWNTGYSVRAWGDKKKVTGWHGRVQSYKQLINGQLKKWRVGSWTKHVLGVANSEKKKKKVFNTNKKYCLQ